MHRLSCNDMVFLHLVESRYSFDGNVVGFRGTRCENNFFRVCSNKIGNLLLIQKWHSYCSEIVSVLQKTEHIPHEQFLQLSHFPIHRHEFVNVDSHNNWSSKVALHQALWDPIF